MKMFWKDKKFFGKFKQQGQTVVEFALVLPIFFLVLFAIIYGGLFTTDYVKLNYAASDAARKATMSTNGTLTQAQRKSIIENLPLHTNWYEFEMPQMEKDKITQTTTRYFLGFPIGTYDKTLGTEVTAKIQAKLATKNVILQQLLPEKFTVQQSAFMSN